MTKQLQNEAKLRKTKVKNAEKEWKKTKKAEEFLEQAKKLQVCNIIVIIDRRQNIQVSEIAKQSVRRTTTPKKEAENGEAQLQKK